MTQRKTGKPTGRKVVAKTNGSRQTVAASTKGYANHIAGSRKEAVHKAFDERGEDKAIALGTKLKLKPSTLKSWISFWKRSGPTKKAPAKKRPASRSKANGKAASATA